ncbi:MAG: hypothetical protein RLZZ385_51 [Pseudomonadota bacterium]
MTRATWYALPLLLMACGGESLPMATATSTAITHVTVIDGINGVRPDLTVVFDRDRITALLPAGSPVDAAEIIDGSGKYLIPGLWDFHVHLTYDERLTAAMPGLFLSWGITSVRDTGGLLEKVLPVVEAMRAPDAVAPRVYFAGPLLDGEFVVYDGSAQPEIGTAVATADDARRVVRELYDAGVSFVKVYEMVTPEVFTAVVETAKELGLPIDSHVPLAMRASVAGPDVDSIEHLRNIELDCAADAETLHATRLALLANPDGLPGAQLRSMLHSLQRLPAVANYDEARCDQTIAALSDTVMVPTLRLNSINLAPPYRRGDWQIALSRLPADVRDDWTAQSASRQQQGEGDTTFAQWSLFLTGRMHSAGVPIGAGTDTPINLSVPGYSLHEELEMLVRAGLTPLEAIAAATLQPAAWFGIEDVSGSIDVGKQADMVLLTADPLTDIRNTRQIEMVVSKGQLVQ